jgi:aminopeptidase N
MQKFNWGLVWALLLSISVSAQLEEDIQCKGIQILEQGYVPSAGQLNFRSDEHTSNYDITYHRLEWEIDPAEYYIKGLVTSYFVPNTDEFDQINVDLAEALQVNTVTYRGQALNFQQTSEDILEIYLPHPLAAGQLDSVSIDYEGAPPRGGIFPSFERSFHGPESVPIIWTLSEPYGASQWWPCKETLTDKIDSLDMYIRAPSGFRAAGNGILVEEIQEVGYTTYHWKHRYPITTYLVATAVTNYRVYSDSVDLLDGRQLEILNYVYPEFYDAARLSSPITIPMMQLFEELFGPYPFKEEKYGHAMFEFRGGMEHQTMSFMFDFRPGLVAHELAHQWFGDKVTCGTFNDIWVNEGFARYGEYLVHENGISNENARSWLINERSSVTSSPNGSVFIPQIFSEARIFDFRLSYRKGGLILHMLRWKLGDEAFFQGLRDYLNDQELAFGYGIGEDVRYHLEQASGQDLEAFFDDWYYGQGYPSYTIMWSQEGNGPLQVTVEQETSNAAVDFFEMPLPIKVIGKNQEQMVTLEHEFSGQSFTVDVPFEVSDIQFDPDLWILTGNNQVVFTTSNEEQNVADNALIIFPNPVKDRLQVQTNDPDLQIQEAEIFYPSGQLVKKINLEDLSETINVAELPAGVYILRIKTEKSLITKRFMKN